MKITGVIQAGGRSTRMGGRPKALIELGGRPIIERVFAALAPSVDDVLVVTNTPELYAFLALPMVGRLSRSRLPRRDLLRSPGRRGPGGPHGRVRHAVPASRRCQARRLARGGG